MSSTLTRVLPFPPLSFASFLHFLDDIDALLLVNATNVAATHPSGKLLNVTSVGCRTGRMSRCLVDILHNNIETVMPSQARETIRQKAVADLVPYYVAYIFNL